MGKVSSKYTTNFRVERIMNLDKYLSIISEATNKDYKIINTNKLDSKEWNRLEDQIANLWEKSVKDDAKYSREFGIKPEEISITNFRRFV